MPEMYLSSVQIDFLLAAYADPVVFTSVRKLGVHGLKGLQALCCHYGQLIHAFIDLRSIMQVWGEGKELVHSTRVYICQ